MLRQEKTNVIRANHLVVDKPPLCQLKPHGESGKIWVWLAQDYAEEEALIETIAIKFGNVEAAEKFKEAFNQAKKDTTAALSGAPVVTSSPKQGATPKAAPKAAAKEAAPPKTDAPAPTTNVDSLAANWPTLASTRRRLVCLRSSR